MELIGARKDLREKISNTYKNCKDTIVLDDYSESERHMFWEIAKEDLEASRTKLQIRLAYRNMLNHMKLIKKEN